MALPVKSEGFDVRVTARLTKDERDRLAARAKENDRTFGAELRRAVRMYLASEQEAVA